jgi:hypothetical protein
MQFRKPHSDLPAEMDELTVHPRRAEVEHQEWVVRLDSHYPIIFDGWLEHQESETSRRVLQLQYGSR